MIRTKYCVIRDDTSKIQRDTSKIQRDTKVQTKEIKSTDKEVTPGGSGLLDPVDHVVVVDLRSAYDPSESADPPGPYFPSDLHPSTSHPTLFSCPASFF